MKSRSQINHRFTELIDLSQFDLTRLHFDSPVELEIQQGNKTIKYYKVPIGSKNKGGVGEFIFELPEFCHSFGVEEFQNDKNQVNSHSVSLSLIDLHATSIQQETQKSIVSFFGVLVEKIKDHLLSIKKEIKKPTLERAELKKLNPMYQSIDEDGNIKGEAWYFSPKLMERKKYSKEDPTDFQIQIDTKFYSESETDEPVEVSPLEFTNKKHFKFRGSIKIENIYIGSKISLQCKIYDGVVKTVTNERKRLTPANKLLEDE